MIAAVSTVSRIFREHLNEAVVLQSMAARANPYHKTSTESFIEILKAEMLQGGYFINETDARIELFASNESYYNTHRRHSSLEYKTPAQFEAQIQSLN